MWILLCYRVREFLTQTHCKKSETSAKCTLRRGNFFCLWKETSESSKNKVEYFTVKHMIWGTEFRCCCSAGTVCGLLILFLLLLRRSFVRYHKAFLQGTQRGSMRSQHLSTSQLPARSFHFSYSYFGSWQRSTLQSTTHSIPSKLTFFSFDLCVTHSSGEPNHACGLTITMVSGHKFKGDKKKEENKQKKQDSFPQWGRTGGEDDLHLWHKEFPQSSAALGRSRLRSPGRSAQCSAICRSRNPSPSPGLQQ